PPGAVPMRADPQHPAPRAAPDTKHGGGLLKGFLIVASVLCLLAAAAWVGLRFIPASFGYAVEAELVSFASLPADDHRLEEWLRAQPGVVPHTVHVRREPARHPNRLVVIFTMVRDGWGRPPFPDLEAACDELGYAGRVGRFRDYIDW